MLFPGFAYVDIFDSRLVSRFLDRERVLIVCQAVEQRLAGWNARRGEGKCDVGDNRGEGRVRRLQKELVPEVAMVVVRGVNVGVADRIVRCVRSVRAKKIPRRLVIVRRDLKTHAVGAGLWRLT